MMSRTAEILDSWAELTDSSTTKSANSLGFNDGGVSPSLARRLRRFDFFFFGLLEDFPLDDFPLEDDLEGWEGISGSQWARERLIKAGNQGNDTP